MGSSKVNGKSKAKGKETEKSLCFGRETMSYFLLIQYFKKVLMDLSGVIERGEVLSIEAIARWLDEIFPGGMEAYKKGTSGYPHGEYFCVHILLSVMVMTSSK